MKPNWDELPDPTQDEWDNLRDRASVAFHETHQFPDLVTDRDREDWEDSWMLNEWINKMDSETMLALAGLF